MDVSGFLSFGSSFCGVGGGKRMAMSARLLDDCTRVTAVINLTVKVVVLQRVYYALGVIEEQLEAQ